MRNEFRLLKEGKIVRIYCRGLSAKKLMYLNCGVGEDS